MQTSAQPALEITGSRQFSAGLADQKLSFTFTTYQAGKLFMIGLHPEGRLAVFERTFRYRTRRIYIKAVNGC